MAVQNRPVRASLQRVFLSNLQRKHNFFGRETAEVVQFQLDQRAVRMQRLQGRIGRHLLLPIYAPTFLSLNFRVAVFPALFTCTRTEASGSAASSTRNVSSASPEPSVVTWV